jgi:hypothetical protein
MVCQKQAATRVVLERLRAAGLGDLCLEVHDAEADRLQVFRAIRSQVDGLRNARPDSMEEERRRLARQISEAEKELDAFARAFHQRHPRIGLSYREMAERDRKVRKEFPGVSPLPALGEVLGRQTVEVLERVCQKARQAGLWFAEGDPLRNPWQAANLEALRLTSGAREEIAEVLRSIRLKDAEHMEYVNRHGPGMPFPTDLATFARVGKDALARLHAASGESGNLARCWLRALRGLDAASIQRARERCLEAREVAAQVIASPLDSHWQTVASETATFPDLATDLLRRLRSLEEGMTASGEAPGQAWLRLIRGQPDSTIVELRRRCRLAQDLVVKVQSAPFDPSWDAALERAAGGEVVAARLLARID